jgi:AcrR family transcriptional regulator
MPSKRPRRSAAVDHRPRVGRQRRARTRARILATALAVFAEKGPDAPVIDDFIRAAGIARGTFYNHFKTTDELLVATSMWLEDELILSIEAEMGGLADPVQRLATGVRLWLHRSRVDPVFCAFIVRNRFRGRLVEQRLAGDIRAGKRDGRFVIPSVAVARDLVVGAIREAMSRMTDARVPRAYVDDLTRLILRGLGVGHGAAEQLLAMATPTMQRRPFGLATSGRAPKRGPGRAKKGRPRSGGAATR